MLQKYILLTVIILYVFSVKSQSNCLVVFSSTGNAFTLKVDEKRINISPQANVKAFQLGIGKHYIEITAVIDTKLLMLKDSVIFIDEPKYFNKEFTYVLNNTTTYLKLNFKSVSEVSAPEIPIVPEIPKIAGPVVDNNIYGNLYKAKDNKPVFYNNYDAQKLNCKVELTDKDIEFGVLLLTKCNDEERKLSYVNDIVKLNCYTTIQLQQLLVVLPSEMDRLAVAKLAYAHITDKKNSENLLPVFKYSTIKDNYKAYINDYENTLKQLNMHCEKGIDELRFNEVFSKIKNGGYDNEKVMVAKKTVVNICLTTEQTKKISQLFTHDREKLEFIKYVRNILVDKENAELLADEFQFTETKNEYLKYIKQ